MNKPYREWVNEAGETAGTFLGTEFDKAHESNPDWTLVASATDAPVEEVAEPTEDNGKEGEATPVDPAEHSRDELNQLAVQAGIEDPETLANKAAVAEAINAKATDAPVEEV